MLGIENKTRVTIIKAGKNYFDISQLSLVSGLCVIDLWKLKYTCASPLHSYDYNCHNPSPSPSPNPKSKVERTWSDSILLCHHHHHPPPKLFSATRHPIELKLKIKNSVSKLYSGL